jgi:hypothetical protein
MDISWKSPSDITQHNTNGFFQHERSINDDLERKFGNSCITYFSSKFNFSCICTLIRLKDRQLRKLWHVTTSSVKQFAPRLRDASQCPSSQNNFCFPWGKEGAIWESKQVMNLTSNQPVADRNTIKYVFHHNRFWPVNGYIYIYI